MQTEKQIFIENFLLGSILFVSTTKVSLLLFYGKITLDDLTTFKRE